MNRRSISRLTGLIALAVVVLLIGGNVSRAELLDMRSITGDGNNQTQSDWGAANTQLLRQADASYPGDMSGATILVPPTRPNPREISNALMSQGALEMPNNRLMSSMVFQWGQFLDHDISLTETSAANGLADIPVDGLGDPLGPNAIPFTRSNFDSSTGDSSTNPRQQINQITAYIDASNVYGSDAVRQAALRTSGGKLATSAGDLLPYNTGGLANGGGPGADLFLAGDVRANEQVGLTAMHTLFVREHNRLVDLLAVQIPTADDDELYETARKIVGAEMQSITYNQFLPSLLGSMAPKTADYSYDNMLNAGINNEFSTAMYRVGHTLLTPNLLLVNSDGSLVDTLPLRDAFFNPDYLGDDPSRVDMVLKGLTVQQAQEIDSFLVDDVRNFLFGPPGAGGMDLASLNIQRGRDHGLPDYNTLRDAYGLPPVASFSEITSNTELADALAAIYENDIDNVDAWVGALAEDHMGGASVGPLITEALIDQFERLRDGDRFFFMSDPDLFTADILSVIDVRTISLTDIVHFNTSMTNLQRDMFFMPEPSAIWIVVVGLVGLFIGRRTGRGLA